MKTSIAVASVALIFALSNCARVSVPNRNSGGGGGANQQLGGAEWIGDEFSNAGHVVGQFSAQVNVETPAFVHDSIATASKYAFNIRENANPSDRRAALVSVTIMNLVSPDNQGAAVYTFGAQGLILYFANVHIEPNWRMWVDENTTNYDGLALDNTAQVYAQDLTIKNWNADAAIENKTALSQFVRLTTEGRGNRTLKYYNPGPHYIVDSNINNDGTVGEGSLLWVSNCSNTTINIYNSTFNGQPTVPSNKVVCETGSNPNIVYLGADPKVSGQMHPMFRP